MASWPRGLNRKSCGIHLWPLKPVAPCRDRRGNEFGIPVQPTRWVNLRPTAVMNSAVVDAAVMDAAVVGAAVMMLLRWMLL